MTTTFSTRQYEISHGRTPKGRGQWGFISANTIGSADETLVWADSFLTLTEAKKDIGQRYPHVRAWEVAP